MAVIAAVVAIAVAIPLINEGARSQAQATLDRLADITVEALQEPSPSGTPDRLRHLLESQNVTPYVIGPGLRPVPGLTESQSEAVVSGAAVSQ